MPPARCSLSAFFSAGLPVPKGTLFRSARAPVLWVCEGKAPALAREALKQTRLGVVAGEGGITEPITACGRERG